MARGNPEPKFKLTRFYEQAVADKPVSVKLFVDQDEYVRSLPNRTEWLRQAIAAQIERDKQKAGSA